MYVLEKKWNKNSVRNGASIRCTRLGEVFFFLKGYKNQCIAALRTYFYSPLEGKRTSQNVHFIGAPFLKAKHRLACMVFLGKNCRPVYEATRVHIVHALCRVFHPTGVAAIGTMALRRGLRTGVRSAVFGC
jgi:hypothetical protein